MIFAYVCVYLNLWNCHQQATTPTYRSHRLTNKHTCRVLTLFKSVPYFLWSSSRVNLWSSCAETEKKKEIEGHCVKQAEIPVILKPQILSPVRIKNVLSYPAEGHREHKDERAKSAIWSGLWMHGGPYSLILRLDTADIRVKLEPSDWKPAGLSLRELCYVWTHPVSLLWTNSLSSWICVTQLIQWRLLPWKLLMCLTFGWAHCRVKLILCSWTLVSVSMIRIDIKIIVFSSFWSWRVSIQLQSLYL